MKKILFVLICLISLSCQSEKDEIIENNNNNNTSVLLNDIDGDGITNDIDKDNNTRQGVPVDENGVMQNPIYLDETDLLAVTASANSDLTYFVSYEEITD